MLLDTNVFQALAEISIAKGEDMEVVARELAQALSKIIKDGLDITMTDEELKAEFLRLSKDQ